MKSLSQQLEILSDFEQQREIACHRFYSRENQAIVLDQITEELRINPTLYCREEITSHLTSKVKISHNVELLIKLYRWLITTNPPPNPLKHLVSESP